MSAGSTELAMSYFRGAHHHFEDLMDALTNGIRFWILNRGWLTLYAGTAYCFKV